MKNDYPHYSAMQSDRPEDGFYINRYWRDSQGVVRRDTPYDCIPTFEAADLLACILNAHTEYETESMT